MIPAPLKTTAFGVVVASLVLAGCTSTTSGRPLSAPETPSSPSASTGTAPSSAAPNSATSAPSHDDSASRPVTVNKTITDTALASSVTVTAEVRHLPGTGDGMETVALRLTFKQGTKYTSGIFAEALQIHAANGDFALPMLDEPRFEALLMQHRLTPVLNDDARLGTTVTAWLPFLFGTTDKASHLVLQYHRDTIEVLGSGKTIPAKTYTIALPA
jgi:hypothetical protein